MKKVFNYEKPHHSPFFSRYENQEVALNSGMILRECLRYEPLAKIVLNAEEFFDLFNYVELSTFDVASDAFSTFKVDFFYVCRIII